MLQEKLLSLEQKLRKLEAVHEKPADAPLQSQILPGPVQTLNTQLYTMGDVHDQHFRSDVSMSDFTSTLILDDMAQRNLQEASEPSVQSGVFTETGFLDSLQPLSERVSPTSAEINPDDEHGNGTIDNHGHRYTFESSLLEGVNHLSPYTKQVL